jgi:hypothetical protein
MNQVRQIHPSTNNSHTCHMETRPSMISSVVLSQEFEEFVKAYAESVHDQWSYAKVS